jgi:hypothetical protein
LKEIRYLASQKQEESMYTIPYMACDATQPEQLLHIFDSLKRERIGCCNWVEAFPYTPKVDFRIFHNGSHLLLRFDVEECDTAAKATDDNGAVWKDSCVEFFFQLEGHKQYYNFETNCIGTLLIGHRENRSQAEHAPQAVLQQVYRRGDFAHEVLPEQPCVQQWSMTLAIPTTALFADKIATWHGVRGKMNLFKCGDDLRQPHYLSWQPIATPKPDFHRPEFFLPVGFAE